MTRESKLRIFIYKRTHSGDPDPRTGVFGNHDCMGSFRRQLYDAVIGVGGKGDEPRRHGIARKLTWIGIGPHKREKVGWRGPLVKFDHFLYYGDRGPLLEALAPALAKRIYQGAGARRIISRSLSDMARLEAEKILRIAMKAPASGKLAERSRLDPKTTGSKPRPLTCRQI